MKKILTEWRQFSTGQRILEDGKLEELETEKGKGYVETIGDFIQSMLDLDMLEKLGSKEGFEPPSSLEEIEPDYLRYFAEDIRGTSRDMENLFPEAPVSVSLSTILDDYADILEERQTTQTSPQTTPSFVQTPAAEPIGALPDVEYLSPIYNKELKNIIQNLSLQKEHLKEKLSNPSLSPRAKESILKAINIIDNDPLLKLHNQEKKIKRQMFNRPGEEGRLITRLNKITTALKDRIKQTIQNIKIK